MYFMRQRGGRPSARDLPSAVGFEQTLLELMGGVFFSYRDDVPDENELGSGAFYAVDRDGGSPVLGWMRVTSRRLVCVCEDDPTPQIVPTATLAVAQCVRTDQGDWLAPAEMPTMVLGADGP